MIKLSDVAKAAGVSQGTASNVFNRPQIVRPEVREKVEAVARELGYSGPDPKGRLLRAGKVNAIGVATAEPLSYFFDDPFARVLMSGISEALDVHGAGISLVSSANDEKLAWNIQSAIVDGFILLCIEGGNRLVELTRDRKLPFVALELDTDDETIAQIGIDDFDGARRIAEHVVDLGHREIAVLSLQLVDDRTGRVTPDQIDTAIYSATRDRLRGYFASLKAAGIDTDAVPVYETENDRKSVNAALEALFDGSATHPTALIAMSDRAALFAIEWLRGRGVAVPEDVSVVGFDGVPEGAFSDPPLTTVTQPIAAMGRLAVQMILEGPSMARRQMLDVELTIRASTAPPRVLGA
ncbi:LacI family DNA-binding transcriptional regulator [Kaistia dalseonensis]|uniref:DNA-binding LacI/PurR family transcriptional regulator n=1 Tax=Kaistia dalseonensis TaxID=410840 RepID=A0ABU0H8S4_9HYPH|nr:LacI family DNA-binding transcriptional regulator [Kaistia dalseonensis]MCX5496101.1 LacI family DNA-binding transcriptional regulator [Kaistia dalseonensis]MDQ0438706.1 DNA-binding LacI/PurR family transcriptional regulator [Kaistia dalseonensis]